MIASRIRTTRAEFNEGERAKIWSLLLDVRGSWWLMRTNDFYSNNCWVVPKTDDFLLSFPSFSQSAEQSWFFCQRFFPSFLALHLISLPPFAGKNWKEKKITEPVLKLRNFLQRFKRRFSSSSGEGGRGGCCVMIKLTWSPSKTLSHMTSPLNSPRPSFIGS